MLSFKSRLFLPGSLALLLAAATLSAQPPVNPATPAASDDIGYGLGPGSTVPVWKNINISMAATTQHDSASGYAQIFTPGFIYRFNSVFSFEAGAPIYSYLNVSTLVNVGTKAKPVAGYVYKPLRGGVGDTGLSAHMDLHPDLLDYSFTASMGAPTGTPSDGTGAGQYTYNFNNHIEHSFGPFSPDIELGIGDSSSLTNTAVHKSYISVGLLGYFQAGSSIQLPHHINFEADAFEAMPLANSTIYSTTGKGKKAVTTATTVGAAEDNGFTTELDIPLNGAVVLTGFYNRSLRDKEDTAGFSLTFSLRPPPRDQDEDTTTPLK